MVEIAVLSVHSWAAGNAELWTVEGKGLIIFAKKTLTNGPKLSRVFHVCPNEHRDQHSFEQFFLPFGGVGIPRCARDCVDHRADREARFWLPGAGLS